MKRKLVSEHSSEVEEQPLCFKRKQLRSQLSRRRRLHIPPVVAFSGEDSHVATVSEVSCDSSLASVSNMNPSEIGDTFRRITRLYYRKRFKDVSRNHDEAMELSEVSCVESCSGTNRGLNSKSPNVEELEVEGGDVTKSEVSSASRFSFSEKKPKVTEQQSSVGTTQSQVVLEIPGVNEICREEIADFEAEKDYSAQDGDVLLHSVERATKISESEAASEEIRPANLVEDFDLACSERFSNGGITNDGEEVDEEEEHNSSSSGIFHVISDSEFESSDYSPSIWSYGSGSQFSEKSFADESPSPTFQLFIQFKQQFCRSTFVLKGCEDHNSEKLNKLGLQEEEDEESFSIMMRRERRQEYVHDYAHEYCNYTAYGDLIIQQRLEMVHWIVEQATDKELQKETMFLGVNLLDRFLSKGYFKNGRNLQIAGIACLTLATRIEENQPYNCVRKKSFYVGSNVYARCEVVAMEWLVQEVLNFQCFLPTLYNFLWFYLKAARANEIVEKTTKYLAVLTLMGHQQLCFWPSTVAAALVIIASIATNKDVATEIQSRNKDQDLPECIKTMEWLVKYL